MVKITITNKKTTTTNTTTYYYCNIKKKRVIIKNVDFKLDFSKTHLARM